MHLTALWSGKFNEKTFLHWIFHLMRLHTTNGFSSWFSKWNASFSLHKSNLHSKRIWLVLPIFELRYKTKSFPWIMYAWWKHFAHSNCNADFLMSMNNACVWWIQQKKAPVNVCVRISIFDEKSSSIIYQVDAFPWQAHPFSTNTTNTIRCGDSNCFWFAFELSNCFVFGRFRINKNIIPILSASFDDQCLSSTTKAWNQQMKINNSFNAPHLIMLLGLKLI